MRRFLGLLTVGTLLAAALLFLTVQNLPAQQSNGDHAAHHPQQGEQAERGMMKTMKMSPGMKLHCRMMMSMEVKPTDPAALLALKDKLELTDEQIGRLEKIREQAREQTDGLLTAEQKKQLEPLKKMPGTCMAMHQEMMQKMMQKGGKEVQAKGGMMQGGCMCPMMAAMEEDEPKSHMKAKMKAKMREKTEHKHGSNDGAKHSDHH